jgi:small-conductance mechanosensitive channel/CRP-like cAMP-binding protein
VPPSNAISPSPSPANPPLKSSAFNFTTTGEMLAAALTIFLLLVATGRLLKRHFGVRLGRIYQLFCAAFSAYLAFLLFFPIALFRRDLGAASAMLGAWVLVQLLDQYFWSWYMEHKRRATVPKFARQLTAAVVMVVTLLFVLQFAYEQRVPGLLAGSGIIAVILGFAMQDALGNIIAGFTLQINRPYKAGDWLLLDNQHVKTVEINLRSTRFVNNDDVQFDMPNQQIVKQTIINYHGGGALHAMRLEIGIEYSAPPNRVKDVLAQAAASAFGVAADPAPSVFLKRFADSDIVYEVRFWLADHRLYNTAADSVRTNIWYVLRRQNIHLSYPVRTLQIERPRKAKSNQPAENDDSTLDILRAQPLFQGLREENLRLLIEQSPDQYYGRGEAIIREGAEGASMFVLMHGEAGVTVAAKGQSTRVATLRDGDCFGEMSLLTGEKRSASVLAITDCEVLELTKAVFAEVIQREADLLPRLSVLLASRQMETEGILQSRAHPPEIMAAKEREYRAGFLNKLRSFFEL